MTYEQLMMNSDQQLKRIEKRWGINMSDSLYESSREASKTTVDGSPILTGKIEEQLNYWKKRLIQKQIDDVLSVLEYFGIELYDSGALPKEDFVG